MAKFRQKKRHWMGASRTRQVSMKVDDELIRDSGRVLNGAPQFLGRLEGGGSRQAIFCLPRFVDDGGQIWFSSGSLARLFLHVRVLRER